MSHTCRIELDGQSHDFPVVEGTENELAIDISALRDRTGYITLDDGYGNTGSCKSSITYIDGDQGILRYRGIPIEQLAESSSFVETAWLVIWGRLPTPEEHDRFSTRLTRNQMIHESLRNHFEGFPPNAHPMAILSAMINAMSCYEPGMMEIEDETTLEQAAARLISKVRTIAAASYKMSVGQPLMYPRADYKYAQNFLHMMFSIPYKDYEPTPEVARALNLFLILHADHEQNCSTSTVRMVASSGANMYASCAAGVCALWGPLHGGANVAVIEMLEFIRQSGMNVAEYVSRVKAKDSKLRLMGFGHRVYKNFDPRAKILKEASDKMLAGMKVNDPLLDIARELEEVALRDPYFVERKLYPNVDFYSGIILRAMGIPLNMFTVMFAMGRVPGWIANWKEIHDDPKSRIYRPRQMYMGNTIQDYVPRDLR
ncbi:MAG: citrate synthase [Candidatus Competibacteraceae bacterium]|uniref:Citrate synthase n=1 Tax=Candidatus Contendobacter odensis Run_B_J11 TaxID=1400861 RepID=A0A7U7J5V4_9GAMM|nr:citrate synthase [Candidatus Contendobacter odensis]MBK8533656.1 citrate synthase [Candidatus Competibacteraceae bacterium]CDH46943.1 Citrate synthase 1 [Candidatus Contendobacter odensis Run_B_J11]